MKKLIVTVLMFALALSCSMLIACNNNEDNHEHVYGDDNTCDTCGYATDSEGLEYELSGDGKYYIVTGIGTCTDDNLVIPDTYNGKPVKEIADHAFKYTGSFFNSNSLKIGNNVEIIGEYAFQFTTFCNIDLGNSVKEIWAYAFYGCHSIREIVIPDSVVYVGGSAFGSDFSLVKATIGKNVEELYYIFVGCPILVEIYNKSDIELTVDELGVDVESIKNIYTPKKGSSKISVDKNGYIMYADDKADEYYLMGKTGDKSETELKLPDSIKGHEYAVYQRSFYNYTNIVKLIVPKKVTGIGVGAFRFELNSFRGTIIEIYNLSDIDFTVNTKPESSEEAEYTGKEWELGYWAKNIYTPDNGESKLTTDRHGNVWYIDDENDEYILAANENSPRLTEVSLPKNINGHSYEISLCAFYGSYYLQKINFGGTVNEWNELDCLINSIEDVTVYCTDGTVTIND